MLNEVHIFKAAPIGDQIIRPTVIHITETIPEMKTLEAAEATYWVEADELAEALHEALPGGVLDRLLIRLMEIKASLWRVPYPRKEAPNAG